MEFPGALLQGRTPAPSLSEGRTGPLEEPSMKPRSHRGFAGTTLCDTCAHNREVVSATGSRYLMCGLSRTDGRFAKYPQQPVWSCEGHRPAEAGQTEEP